MNKLRIYISVFAITCLFIGLGAHASVGIPWTSLPPQPLETIISAENKWERTPTMLDASTFPSVNEDIQALLSSETTNKDLRSVIQRIKQRSKKILPQLHDALTKTDLTPLQKRRLNILLAVNKDPSSIKYIIDATLSSPEDITLTQSTLRLLAAFEQTEMATQYVDSILNSDSSDDITKEWALLYFVAKPNVAANKWVDKYTQPEVSPNLKVAALILGAKLGVKSVKDMIIKHVNEYKTGSYGGNKISELKLLKSLVDITTFDEFNHLTKNSTLRNKYSKKINIYLVLRRGSKEERIKMLGYLFTFQENRRTVLDAINTLIETKDAETLAVRWAFGDPFIRKSLSEAGYSIALTINGPTFVDMVDDAKNASSADFASPKVLAKKILAVLANDYGDKSTSVPIFKQHELLFIRYGMQVGDETGRFKKFNVDNYSDYKSDIYDSLDKARKNGIAANINWNNVTFISEEHEIMVYGHRMLVTDIHITLLSKKQEYKLLVPDSIYFDGEWKVVSPLQWVTNVKNTK